MAATQRIVREKRREQVELMALQGLSTRDIEQEFVRAIESPEIDAVALGMVNPNTGDAWDHTTISRDLTYLEGKWKEVTLEERVKHKGRQLAELRIHRRSAWQVGELAEVRLGIKAEMELLGTADLPDGSEERPFVVKVLKGVSADDL